MLLRQGLVQVTILALVTRQVTTQVLRVVIALLVQALAINEKDNMKDHLIAKLVNDLTIVSREFHGAQQLRERISHLVNDALKGEKLTTLQQEAARYRLIRNNKLSITAERDTIWTRPCGSKFVCSWSISGTNTEYLLAEDSLDKMLDACAEFINEGTTK